jgi:hypothetical protein
LEDVVVVTIDKNAISSPRVLPSAAAVDSTYGIGTGNCSLPSKSECMYYWDTGQVMVTLSAALPGGTQNLELTDFQHARTEFLTDLLAEGYFWRKTNVLGVVPFSFAAVAKPVTDREDTGTGTDAARVDGFVGAGAFLQGDS